MIFDQFTRWTCAKCGKAGFDSWNKAMHDGIDHQGDYPNPWVLGDTCQECGHYAVTSYTTPETAPRAIYAPSLDIDVPAIMAHEDAAFKRFEENPKAGEPLQPSDRRDGDWSRGCVAAKAQLQ